VQGQVEPARRGRERAGRRGEVALLDLPVLEGQAGRAVGLCRRREQQDARGVAVDAVDDVDAATDLSLQALLHAHLGRLAAGRDHRLAGRLGDGDERAVVVEQSQRWAGVRHVRGR
jgi:hypothetical protein